MPFYYVFMTGYYVFMTGLTGFLPPQTSLEDFITMHVFLFQLFEICCDQQLNLFNSAELQTEQFNQN